MFINGGQYTNVSSSKVLAALTYAANNPGTFAVLTLVAYIQSSGINAPEESLEDIAVRADPSRQNTTLANGTQVIRCLTRGKKRCDIILAPPESGQFEPALVLLEAD